MKCKTCQSDNVVKASVAYEMGTSSGTFNSLGVGAADGGFGVGIGRSGGQMTSEFAQRVKPPSTAPSELGCALFAAVAVLALIVYLFDPPARNGMWAVLILGPTIAAGYFTYTSMKPAQQAERQAKMAKYDRLWVCLRCGTIADKEEFAKEA